MNYPVARILCVTALFVLSACSTTTTTEGAEPVDFDGLGGGTDTIGAPTDDTASGDTTTDTASTDGAGAGACTEEGVECEPGEVCNEETGACEPADCTEEGVECGPDEVCNPETGACEPPGGCGGTGVECAPNEQCNPVTGACEPIPQCGAVDEECDPSSPEPLPYVCIEYDPGKGICREHCVGPTFDEAINGTYIDPCGDDYDCAAPPGEASYCVPSGCTSFFDNDCGPDATCLPTWVNDVNACVPDGLSEYGDLCDVHTDCDHDLLCVDGVCADADCAPFSDVPACGGQQQCISAKVGAEELDMGWCADACDVFYTDCPEDSWCIPELDKPSPGSINGYCIPDLGDAPEGTECENAPNICDEGLLCVKSSSEPAVCERVCDPDAKPPITQGACGDEQSCIPLLIATDTGQLDEVLDFGSCAAGCTPWTPQALSGCEGTWCLPAMFNPSDGQCLGDIGQSQKGQPCDDTSLETSCASGQLCIGADLGAPLSGTCRVLCQVGAAPGSPGSTCIGGESCDELVLNGANFKQFETGIGWCNPHD